VVSIEERWWLRMQVKAAVAHEPGKPLSIETVVLEGPKEGEVLVEIKATGVCQRSTTLYMEVEGEIPPYYTEADITIEPRDHFYN
jgi:D-arabinose 1-dehydrogenase-like Zn-dependent alcohol dehydrogenase